MPTETAGQSYWGSWGNTPYLAQGGEQQQQQGQGGATALLQANGGPAVSLSVSQSANGNGIGPPGQDTAREVATAAGDRGDAPRPKQKLLWAEGLRGIAAAIVVNQHWVSGFATEMNNGYGPGPAENFDGGQDHGSVVAWLCWPGLRVLYNGTFTVYVFFVLSGFVLTHRYLSMVKNGILKKAPQGLAHAEKTIGSTMLRRFPRLFIPCLVVTLISYMILALGGYDQTSTVALYGGGNPDAWFHRVAPNRETSSNFLRLFRQVWASMWINKVNDLDSSMWTMAYELTGSVYSFAAALVLGRAAGLRWPPITSFGGLHWMMLAAALWCMTPSIYETYSYYSCFFFGIGLAWLDIDEGAMPWRAWIRRRHPVDESKHPIKQKNAWILEIIPTMLFILSLWLASFPMRGSSIAWANPLRVVAQFFYAPDDPEELVKMWYPLGAVFMVWAIIESRWLRWVFGNPVCVFLGQISFMSYLIHGPLLWSAGGLIFLKFYQTVKLSYDLSVFVSFLIYWCYLIPIAWILYWTVDFPAGKFAQWFEEFVSGGDGKPPKASGGEKSTGYDSATANNNSNGTRGPEGPEAVEMRDMHGDGNSLTLTPQEEASPASSGATAAATTANGLHHRKKHRHRDREQQTQAQQQQQQPGDTINSLYSNGFVPMDGGGGYQVTGLPGTTTGGMYPMPLDPMLTAGSTLQGQGQQQITPISGSTVQQSTPVSGLAYNPAQSLSYGVPIPITAYAGTSLPAGTTIYQNPATGTYQYAAAPQITSPTSYQYYTSPQYSANSLYPGAQGYAVAGQQQQQVSPQSGTVWQQQQGQTTWTGY